jgi:hypothetical protein
LNKDSAAVYADAGVLSVFGRSTTHVINQITNRAGQSVLLPANVTTVSKRAATIVLGPTLFGAQNRSDFFSLQASGTFFVVSGRSQTTLVGI